MLKKIFCGIVLVVGIWLEISCSVGLGSELMLNLRIISKYFSSEMVSKFFSLEKRGEDKRSLLCVDICGLVNALGFGEEAKDKGKDKCFLRGISVKEYERDRSLILTIGEAAPIYYDYYIFLFGSGKFGQKICYWVKNLVWNGTIEDLNIGFWGKGDLFYVKYTNGWGTGLRMDRLGIYRLTDGVVNRLLDLPIEGHFNGLPTKLDWRYKGTAKFVSDTLEVTYRIEILRRGDNYSDKPEVIVRKMVFNLNSEGFLEFNSFLSDISLENAMLLEGDDMFICQLSDKCKGDLAELKR